MRARNNVPVVVSEFAFCTTFAASALLGLGCGSGAAGSGVDSTSASRTATGSEATTSSIVAGSSGGGVSRSATSTTTSTAGVASSSGATSGPGLTSTSGSGAAPSSATSSSTAGSSSISASSSASAEAFNACRFHFGAIDSTAKGAGTSLVSQLDMFTSGWIGSGAGLATSVCNESNPGGALAGKVPALVAYIISFTARSKPGWCLADCNANNANCTPASDLCTKGADYIRQEFTSTILPEYISYAQSFAAACGTTQPIIWEMEPDYFQYYDAAQGGGTRGQPGGPLSGQEAANYMSQMVAAVKKYLPNAVFSMDISPWMPNNGCSWYSFFNMNDFTFVSTSGGGTLANSANIRAGQDTWAGIHQCSGNKPILADTGYGAAGGSAGPDPAWDVPANINARIANGVISITQYNPNAATWGATLAAARPALSPVGCF